MTLEIPVFQGKHLIKLKTVPKTPLNVHCLAIKSLSELFFSVNSSSFYICKAIFYESSWVDVLYFLYSYYLNLNWFYFCLYIQTSYVCSLVTVYSFKICFYPRLSCTNLLFLLKTRWKGIFSSTLSFLFPLT